MKKKSGSLVNTKPLKPSPLASAKQNNSNNKGNNNNNEVGQIRSTSPLSSVISKSDLKRNEEIEQQIQDNIQHSYKIYDVEHQKSIQTPSPTPLSPINNSSQGSPSLIPRDLQQQQPSQQETDELELSNFTRHNIPPQLLEKLATFPLFKNAPRTFHNAIAGRLKLVQHHAQEYIVRFGEPAKSMYWILRGSVAVTSPDGEAVHAELVAGQFFGEIGILFNRPRTATVVARTKVLLGVLTADNFNAVLSDFPAVERMIRDEAQERLSMQDKRKRNGVTNIISKPNSTMKSLPRIHDNVDHSIPTRDFLRSLPMFTLLPSNIIHELVLGVEPTRFEPFEYIVRKGELGRDIYFIVNGEVEVLSPKRISLTSSHGNKDKKVDHVLARLGTGQYFGEMAFLQSISKHDRDFQKIERSADIRSVSTVDLLIVSGDQLENLYSRYPRICDEMRETAKKRNDRNQINTQDDDQQHQEELMFKDPFKKWKVPDHLIRSASPLSESSSTTSQLYTTTSTAASSFSTAPPSSIFDNNEFSFQRRRSIATITQSIDPRESSSSPLTLNVPPLNPVLPSLNSFPSHQRTPQPFQYMNHAKRLRLASISGRRRSSVLSTGPLPDRILLKVFEFLSLPELMKLRIICRRWRQLLYVAPGFFEVLDLKPYNTSIDDDALIQITDFVGSRPKVIDISDCFHITDLGFCYMVNEIGMSGSIQIIKMRSVWDVSAMAIMDVAVPSIGHHIVELDLSNCRKVRDDVVERLIGWKNKLHPAQTKNSIVVNSIDDPIPGMEEFDDQNNNESAIGCANLKNLNLGYCKHLTDRSMYHIALHANDRLESLDLTRCTTITDAGFAYWAYQPFPYLTKLKLSDCTFLTDKTIVAIASSAQGLTFLDLSFCCALTDVSIEVLCLGCPNLKHLDLSFCGSAISDSTLLAISIHLRNLESLVIKGCVRVTRSGVDALLSSSIPLKYLDISQCRNAHFYRADIPAPIIKPNPNSKSAFVTTSYDRVVELVI
ncbi:hypothetical protein WICANDRAFT_25768 [Wickerhamomyces anomalus NRRL Y-366-8]|uniref:Cyclic nucleotide-binding domain-containing protein n=1 Tax=Wickerhamomyces anomalus (strain ATCC 58044 / CBS 1984 / NCYC 433 / NRRL Y-366-8) TaxID=683960 RepID=A0A1E3PCL0_WICAA|nr:uncharacterized protein WICANDRAFT_25768 [Wickerhamomyces anomalus NRRL Y-366-8]ODQ62617.1 hypothetical protein WICANDRAFT_25768 [Wickerhamomyces anomalus NRRL Y-366-8]